MRVRAACWRLGLLVAWQHLDAPGRRVVQREAIECKVWRDGKKDPLAEARRDGEGATGPRSSRVTAWWAV